MYDFEIFVENRLITQVWFYFWTLHVVPFFYIYVITKLCLFFIINIVDQWDLIRFQETASAPENASPCAPEIYEITSTWARATYFAVSNEAYNTNAPDHSK